LPEAARAHLQRVDAVLHAGDVIDAGVLDRLRSEASPASVHAVLGNNDTALARLLPETKVLELGGVRIGMVHDSGRSSGRAERMRRLFPDCAVVVFGHSHAPLDQLGVDGQRLFNPGSPTQRRLQPRPSFGLLKLSDGAILEHRIEVV
jgi:putative phosphoesterase